MGEAKRRAAQGLPPREKKSSEKKASDTKAGAKAANAKPLSSAVQGRGKGSASTSPRLVSWLPLTREQADRFVSVSTRGAWIGIGALVFFWVTVRFLGPALGWWTLADG